MEDSNKQPDVSSATGINSSVKKLNSGLAVGLAVGLVLGAGAMFAAYPYLMPQADDNEVPSVSQSTDSEKNQMQITDSVTPVLVEGEWNEYMGKFIRGEYTESWEIKETLSESEDRLEVLNILYKETPIVKVNYLGGGIGYRLVCEDYPSIPSFADTNKTLYSTKDWELNGYNPKFVEIKDQYKEFSFLNHDIRRVSSSYYYDYHSEGTSFEPDCSAGLEGMMPPFSRIDGTDYSNNFTVDSIKDNEEALLQLDRILGSLEEVK